MQRHWSYLWQCILCSHITTSPSRSLPSPSITSYPTTICASSGCTATYHVPHVSNQGLCQHIGIIVLWQKGTIQNGQQVHHSGHILHGGQSNHPIIIFVMMMMMHKSVLLVWWWMMVLASLAMSSHMVVGGANNATSCKAHAPTSSMARFK